LWEPASVVVFQEWCTNQWLLFRKITWQKTGEGSTSIEEIRGLQRQGRKTITLPFWLLCFFLVIRDKMKKEFTAMSV
jgi:hypothetical protein